MRDRELEVYAVFDRKARERAVALLTDDVVAEHAANPAGPHSDRLQRLMRYFRRAPIPGKYVIVAVRPWAEYRIGVLTGVRGAAPEVLDDGPFGTEEEAMHGVFLRRVADLRPGGAA